MQQGDNLLVKFVTNGTFGYRFIYRQQEIDERIRIAENELKEAEKNPKFRKQMIEMTKEYKELIKLLEEIKESNN